MKVHRNEKKKGATSNSTPRALKLNLFFVGFTPFLVVEEDYKKRGPQCNQIGLASPHPCRISHSSARLLLTCNYCRRAQFRSFKFLILSLLSRFQSENLSETREQKRSLCSLAILVTSQAKISTCNSRSDALIGHVRPRAHVN